MSSLRRDLFSAATIGSIAGVVAWLSCRRSKAEVSSNSSLQQKQKESNRVSGPRVLPSSTILSPEYFEPSTKALVEGPYSPFWDLHPKDDADWRKVVAESAAVLSAQLLQQRAFLGVSIAHTTIAGLSVYRLSPKTMADKHKDQLIIQLHGGGYVFGPGESGTGEAMLMAAYGGYEVLAIDYRMPPDAPYPAALDDATSVWKAITATRDSRTIAVEGTSAGGGLALALMQRLKKLDLPLPAAVAAGSPWADLSSTGDSYKTNEWLDNVLVTYDGYLGRAAKMYARGRDLYDPELSPIYGDFRGMPPVILLAGTRDLLLSDAVRTQRKFREFGVDSNLQLFDGISHAQFASDPYAPITVQAFSEITSFFDIHLTTHQESQPH